jgi:hypothetical protein
MPVNYGANADSKPAVYNERSTGALSGEQGPIRELRTAMESRDSWTQLLTGGQSSDTNFSASVQQATLAQDAPLRVGRVMLALPYVHCYKIQISGRQGSCIATAVSRNSPNPLGVKTGEVIPPNSPVLVWQPNTSSLAYILAVLPQPSVSDTFNASDRIQQGGNSGPKKVEAYRNIAKASGGGHGFVSQSCGRPIDGTIGEYVRMSETGIGLLIDSFQSYLRVNEACGLWLNYFDSYAKLAGLSLQIQSYCEHVFQQYDEGELFSMRGYATYPWESVGMYGPGEDFTRKNDVKSVQLDRDFPFGAIEPMAQSITPVYRLTEHTGYLGQGFNRTLVRPAQTSGPRFRTEAEQDKDIGLFNEFLTLDGSYGLRSAKQILFAKYPLIPSPRRKRAVEDAQGDDFTKDNNYRFSGQFGEGDEHKVRDWQDSNASAVPNMLRTAGVLDFATRHFNWKSTHPFQYHAKDYSYPDEGDNASPLSSVQFYRGQFDRAYVEVSPSKLRIDDRYQDVNYYNTASFFSLNEDGGVVIADGYGSQITMAGGQIRLEAGGDVMLMSGSRVVTLAKEAIVRAKSSVDISASDNDVRIKAEKNLQLLGGNSGSGGVLIESKGQGMQQNYAQKIGDKVEASGIVLLSRGGSVNLLSRTAYVRTGVEEGNAEGSGDFVIDCASGRSRMVSYASGHVFFNSEGMGLWHSPSGQDTIEITESNYLGPQFSKIQGPTVMARDVCIIKGGSLGVDRGVYARGMIIALRQMACFRAIVGDSSSNDIPAQISKFISDFTAFSEQITELGLPLLQGYFTSMYWQEKNPGNRQLLSDEIGFSFRDESRTGSAYEYGQEKFFLLEPRWQQLGRLGLTQGQGPSWSEKPVQYQGDKLYPWPGKVNWIDSPTLLQYDGFVLFGTDKAKGRDAAKAAYESPNFNDWQRRTCDGTYTL